MNAELVWPMNKGEHVQVEDLMVHHEEQKCNLTFNKLAEMRLFFEGPITEIVTFGSI